MVNVKFLLFTTVLLVIGCSHLSMARRPYFSEEEEDAIENQEAGETLQPEDLTEGEEEMLQAEEEISQPEEKVSVPEIPRIPRKLHMKDSLENYEHEAQEEEIERVVPVVIQAPEEERIEEVTEPAKSDEPVPCTCGIFMTGQFHKGSKAPPKGNPIVMNEMEETFQCSPVGKKHCTNKCLEILIKHLPNSPALICAAADRDIHRERAYLFVKNCEHEWHNSNLSAGREYCCKDNEMVKCPSS